jgi:DNA modification methylase
MTAMVSRLYHNSQHCRLYLGDSLTTLKELPSRSVDVIIFSPPYWMQRNYGIEGQLGMEPDHRDYLGKLLAVTAACKRVLKNTGSLWIIIEDSYNTGKLGGITSGRKDLGSTITQKSGFLESQNKAEFVKLVQRGIPERSRLMLPERMAIEMIINQYWCLRNDICWYKRNAMPESAKSRLTTSWEHIYFFTKQGDGYVFDTRYERFATSQQEMDKRASVTLFGGGKAPGYGPPTYSRKSWEPNNEKGRIMRDVWDIPSKGYEGKHFATYPVELVTPMIEACCPVQGSVVLDPFAGVCTTGIAALKLGRNFVGVDINESFLKEGINRMDKYIGQERLF